MEFTQYDKILNKMSMGFWNAIKKPIFALAPMDGITDSVFRQMVARYGKPDAMFTEFVPVDGLCSRGRENILPTMRFFPEEKPLVVQFFGSNPDNFFKAAKIAHDLGFDGIDINMGCPYKNIIAVGAGSALINHHSLAKEIILAAKEGAKGLPVSVKTRIGFSRDEVETWIPRLLEFQPAVISLHGRTAKEMYRLEAMNWNAIKRAREVRDSIGSSTLIIGNGGVASIHDAEKMAREFRLDGIMIGRAAIGNPWFFDKKTDKSALEFPSVLSALLEHARLFQKFYGSAKNFSVLKKHFAAYCKRCAGARSLRSSLMLSKNIDDVEKIIASFCTQSKISLPFNFGRK